MNPTPKCRFCSADAVAQAYHAVGSFELDAEPLESVIQVKPFFVCDAHMREVVTANKSAFAEMEKAVNDKSELF